MNGLAKAIVLTGLLVGTTDIVAAIISEYIKKGVFPEKMFNYLGGGILGLERWEIFVTPLLLLAVVTGITVIAVSLRAMFEAPVKALCQD